MGSVLAVFYKLSHRGDDFSNVGVGTIHVPIIHTDLDGSVMVSITQRTYAECERLPDWVEVPLDNFCSVHHRPLTVLIGPADGQEGITFSKSKKIFGRQILGLQAEGENLSVGNDLLGGDCDRLFPVRCRFPRPCQWRNIRLEQCFCRYFFKRTERREMKIRRQLCYKHKVKHTSIHFFLSL